MSKQPHPTDKSGRYFVPSRVPSSIDSSSNRVTNYRSSNLIDTLERIENNQRNCGLQKEWLKVKNFPSLVYETKNRFDDLMAEDMQHGNEDRQTIERYGFMQPFKQWVQYDASSNKKYNGEDEFNLPSHEHFKRMKDLGDNLIFGIGFSSFGRTKEIFFKMLEKFKRNEGGIYMHPALDNAMRVHETTATFHSALIHCLSKNINNGTLPSNIRELTSKYMIDNNIALPHFKIRDGLLLSDDLFNGTVITVHGIWAMRVYVENLEYKGELIRGIFKYEIQDHFGLNSDDINHINNDSLMKKFELLRGFRSWYLLQHYTNYNFKPFITEIRFTL
ncbi:TPA: DUF3289 family protein [Photobacterium damselae]